MRGLAFGVLALVLLVTTVSGNHDEGYYGYYCNSDDDCRSLWATKCNTNSYYCEARNCSQVNPSCENALLSCSYGMCAPATCMSDADCTGANIGCNNMMGYCDCKSGYTMWNGQCSQVLNRVCADDKDCLTPDGKYNCDNNVCTCDPDIWLAGPDTCISYVNQTCNSAADCGAKSNTTCNGGFCLCSSGFKEKNGSCQAVNGMQCTTDTDCGGVQFMSCNIIGSYYNGYPGATGNYGSWSTQSPMWNNTWTNSMNDSMGGMWSTPGWNMNGTTPYDGYIPPECLRPNSSYSTPWYNQNYTSYPPWFYNSSSPYPPYSSSPPNWYYNSSDPYMYNGSYSTTPPYWYGNNTSPPYWYGNSSTSPPYWYGNSSTSPPYWYGNSSTSPPYWYGNYTSPPSWYGNYTSPPSWYGNYTSPPYWNQNWTDYNNYYNNWTMPSYCEYYLNNNNTSPPWNNWNSSGSTPSWNPSSSPSTSWGQSGSSGGWSTPNYNNTYTGGPNYGWINYGTCKCQEGYTFIDSSCVKVLGKSCNMVTCGNSSHFSYEYMHVYVDPSYAAYHSGYYCNVDDVCTCSEGYMESADSMCVPIYSSSCATSADCGGNSEMFTCNMTGQCDCGPAFIPSSAVFDPYDMYNYNYMYYATPNVECISVIGQSCSFGCDAAGAVCGSNDTCICDVGFAENGICTQVLGHICDRDTQCSKVGNAFCSDTGCACKPGFEEIAGQDKCEPYIGRPCATAADCMQDNDDCVQNVCTCAVGFLEVDGQCLPLECGGALPFPDIHRRGPGYKPMYKETMLSDTFLVPGVYSLGRYRPAATAAQLNHCGTKYPIHLTAVISPTDEQTMDAGTPVTKTAQISGVASAFGIPDTFDITFRKCGGALHMDYTPPDVAFSGLCLVNNIPSNPSGNTTGRWAMVSQGLTFIDEDDGTGMFKPQVSFTCQALDRTNYYYPYPSYGYYDSWSPYFTDDGRFYTVNWYINDVHFASKGPASRPFLNTTDLMEWEITQQYPNPGFDVRCSYEWSETMFGPMSSPVFSEEVPTGFRPTIILANETDNYFQLMSNTPIGCRGIYDPSVKTCDVTVNLADDSACAAPLSANPHPLCGITLRGITKAGLENYGNWESAKWSLSTAYEYDYVTYQSIYEQFVTMLQVNPLETHTLSDVFRMRFAPAAVPENDFWDGFVMPDIKVKVNRDNNREPNNTCSVIMEDVPVIRKTFEVNGVSEVRDIRIEAAGEYTLVRSRLFPVEAQIKVEPCTTASGGFCACAFTYRNGDSIVTQDLCGGVYRDGPLRGTTSIDYLGYTGMVKNGITGMSTLDYNNGAVNLMLQDWYSPENFRRMDGLCIFEPESFTLSTGEINQDGADFVSSWQVAPEKSLLNPASYESYNYTEHFYQCDCPLATDTFPVTEQNISDWAIYKRTFTGAVSCTMATPCSVEHGGVGQWNGSVLPLYTLDTLNATFHVDDDGDFALLCGFDKLLQYSYEIVWYADDLPATGPMANQSLKLDDLYTSYRQVSDVAPINREWSCEVTVREDGEQLLQSRSAPKEMVTLEEDVFEMTRNGEATVNFRLNLPVQCKSRGPGCSVEVRVFDELDDYSCQNSTIAVKGSHTCGTFFTGGEDPATYPRDLSVRLKTKNNNKYVLRNSFSLTVELQLNGDVADYWSGPVTKKINVLVRDDVTYWQNTYCYSTNDPRIRTFDGHYYSIIDQSLIDEFVMMKHKELPIEVHMLTESCNWGLAACGCGVVVRAGGDVFTVSHCFDDHITGFIQNLDGVLEAKKRSDNRYNIYLPQGTMIDVVYYKSEWFSTMNIMIYPSPADMNKLEGLCGNFDGVWDNDLVHSTGATTTVSTGDWWTITDPDDFSQSWGLINTNKISESLLNPDYVANLASYSSDEDLCVCHPGSNGLRSAVCSKKEDGTCTGAGRVKPGDPLEINVRQERSVDDHREADMRERLTAIHQKMRENSSSGQNRVRRQVPDNPDAVNHTEAIRICNESLSAGCAPAKLADNTPSGTNASKLLEDCAKDVMLNKTINWFDSSCSVMQGAVETLLTLDVKFKEENQQVVAELEEAVKCVGNCNGHGTCTAESTCACDSGWAGNDCGVSTSAAPVALRLQGDGQCHRNERQCDSVYITTRDGCTENIACKRKRIDITAAGEMIEGAEESSPCTCDDGYTVTIDVTSGSRRKRSTGNSTVVATANQVTLSNDGSSFGSPNTVVSFDTTCLDVNITENTVTLLPGYCIISGTCYADGVSLDTCSFCNVTADVFAWSNNDSVASCVPAPGSGDDDGDGDSGGTSGGIIAAAVIIPIVLLGGGVAGFLIYKKIQAGKLAAARTEANLYDGSKNNHFKVRVEPSPSTPVQMYKMPDGTLNPDSISAPNNLYTDHGQAPNIPDVTMPTSEA